MRRTLTSLLTITHPHADVQRRGRIIVTMMLTIMIICILALPTLIGAPAPLQSSLVLLLGILLAGAVIPLARRGQVTVAGWILVVGIVLILLLPIVLRPGNASLLYLVVPVLVASVVLRPKSMLVVLLGVWAVLGLIAWLTPQAVTDGQIDRILVVALILTTICGIIGFMSASVTATAFQTLSDAEAALAATARTLETVNTTLNKQVEERTAALAATLHEVQTRAEAQAALLAEIADQRTVIHEMSVPILPVSADVLVMPLIGALQADRVQLIHHPCTSTTCNATPRPDCPHGACDDAVSVGEYTRIGPPRQGVDRPGLA
jgi:rsbT co-antagonist protein RsbR